MTAETERFKYITKFGEKVRAGLSDEHPLGFAEKHHVDLDHTIEIEFFGNDKTPDSVVYRWNSTLYGLQEEKTDYFEIVENLFEQPENISSYVCFASEELEFTAEQVMLVVKIGNEAKTSEIKLKLGFTKKYNIDISHSINLEFFFDEKERLVVTWKDTEQGIRTAECDRPDIINTVCENPVYVMAFIATTVDTDEFISRPVI